MNIPEIAIGIGVGALIALGRELGAIRQAKKDLNGLGGNTRKLSDQQVKMLITQLIVTGEREDREVLARPFL